MPKPKTSAASWLALSLAVLSGAALAYAMPPHSMALLGWVALAPLLIAARLTRPVCAAGLGLVAAFVCGGVLAGGSITELRQIGNLIGAFGSLGLVFALVAGAASATSKRLPAGWWLLSVACTGMTAEFLSQYTFPVTIAISEHQNPEILRVASVVGIWGAAFLLWLAQAAVAALFQRPKVAAVAITVVAVVLAVARWAPRTDIKPQRLRVAAIQADGPVTACDLTASLKDCAIVVWPEFLLDPRNDLPATAARSSGAFLVASVREEIGGKPCNSAYLLTPHGTRHSVFRKQHLFGRESVTFKRGKPRGPVEIGKLKAGVAICYDTEFTDVVREQVRQGAQIILVPNHDPEIPNHLFNHLHAAVIPFRAAENGVPIVWAEANALSMIVGPDGRIIAQARKAGALSVCAEVPLRVGKTVFTRTGDLFAYLCAIGCVILLVLPRKQHGRQCWSRPATREPVSAE